MNFRKKCSSCKEQSMELEQTLYNTALQYDGREYDISLDLQVIRCSKCKHTIVPDASYDLIINDMVRQAGILTPAEIAAHRTSCGYTQKQLGDMFGVGEATVSRWESGGQIQQRTMDAYLRAFFAVPELRKYLEQLHGIQL